MKRSVVALFAVLAIQARAQDTVEEGASAEPDAAVAPTSAAPASGPSANQAATVAALSPAVDTSRTTSPGPAAIDRLDLGTTSITGNQELPKVLYIVPWKQSDLGDIVGRPVNTLLDEVLSPVDPDVFERHLSYYESLYGERQE